MSQSFLIECPHCHARGELVDPTLLGRPLACPACQQVFVAPAPPGMSPAAATPAVVAPTTNPVPAPTVDVGFPTAPASPSPFPGAAEQMFASSLPQPAARSSATSRPPQSKMMMTLVWSGVSSLVLFAAVMFLLGDPFRNSRRKPVEAVVKKEAKNSKKKAEALASDPSLEETLAKLQGRPVAVKPPAVTTTSPAPEAMVPMAEPQPAKPPEVAVVPAAPKPMPTPTADNTLAAVDSYVPPALDDGDDSENSETIPKEAQAKLEGAYNETARPLLIEFLTHAHAGVRERAAGMLEYHQPSPDLAAPLLKLMQDPNSRVRVAAANALRKHGLDSAGVIPLLGAVVQKDPVRDVRSSAAATLKVLGTGDEQRASAVAAVLIPALRAAREDDVGYIAAAFGPLGEAAQPVIPQLIKLLKKERCASDVAEALAELGQAEALAPLVSKNNPNGNSIKSNIAEGIGRQKAMNPALLDLLKTLSQDKDEYVRQNAIRALQTCEPKLSEAIPLLELAQADTAAGVREAAAAAIANYEIKPDAKVRGLLKQMALAKPDAWERTTIADTIRKMKADGMRSLVELLVDPEAAPELRDAAAQVMAVSYWDQESHDAACLEQMKKLVQNAEQPLATRACCAIVLKQFDRNLPQMEPILKEAVVAQNVNTKLRQKAAYSIDHSNPAAIAFFNDVALKCEVPLADDATDQMKIERREFYQAILGNLTGAELQSGKKDHSACLPRYLAAIRQPDPEVKETALDALRTLAAVSPEAVEAARSMLKHENNGVRRNALRALGSMHQQAAATIPEIRAALKDQDQYVSQVAAETLGEFGPAAADAVPELLAILNNSDLENLNSNVPIALAKIAPKDEVVRTTLIRLLDLEKLPAGVLAALHTMGPNVKGAVPALRKLIPVSSNSENQLILQILSRQGAAAKPALPEMIQLLDSPDTWTRSSAITAISQLKEHAVEAVPQLVKLVSSGDQEVQSSAIMGIQKMGPAAKSAIPDLEKAAAAAKTPYIRQMIQNAINRLSAKAADGDGELFTLLAETETTAEVVEELARDPAAALPGLARLSGNSDDSVRQRASTVLTMLVRQPASKQELKKLLDSDDPRNQALAAVLLYRLPTQGDRGALVTQLLPWTLNESTARSAVHLINRVGPEAVASLATLLTSESTSSKQRRQLLDIVKYEIGPSRMALLPPLLNELKSDSRNKQQAAVLAVAMLDPRHAEILPAVLTCLNDRDPATRRAAVAGLSEMKQAEVDISAAVPGLLKSVIANPAALQQRSEDEHALFQAAARLLADIGAPADQLPELRMMLRTANEQIAQQANAEIFPEYGMFAVSLLASLGPQASDALPEIGEFIDRVGDRGFSNDLQNIGPPAVAMLSEMARDANKRPETRKSVIGILGQMAYGDDEAPPVLTELLKDPDLKIRMAAAMPLINHPDRREDALLVLRDAVRSDDKNAQYAAVHGLEQLGGKAAAAVPDLVELASKTESWRVRSIATALMAIAPENPDVHNVFAESLKTQSDWTFSKLKSRGQSLIPRLIKLVQEESDPQRMNAAEVLGQFEEKAISAAGALKVLMNADQGDAGTAAAISLARIDPTAVETLPRLIAAFDNQRTRYKAVRGLQRLGPNAAEALPKLLQTLDDESYYGQAYSIIGKLGAAAKPALPQLVETLSDPQQGYLAAQALVDMGPEAQEVGPELIALLRSGQENVGVAKILVKMGQPAIDAVQQIQADLQHDEKRLDAIRQLSGFGALAEPAAPQLLELAKGTDVELRMAAMAILGHIESRAAESVPVLASALSDSDPQIVSAASLALCALGKSAAPAMPQILAALEKESAPSRWLLLQLVGNLGPVAGDAVPTLEKMTKSSDLSTRRMARLAIKRIQSPEEPKTDDGDSDDAQ